MTPVMDEIEGAKELDGKFARLTDLFDDLRPVFEKLRDKFFPLIQRRFDQGGPGWPALAAKTEARKANLYGGPSRILVATQSLYNSFSVGGGGSVERIGAKEAEFGSSIYYGFFHQEGLGVPQRKIIDITDQDEKEFADVAHAEIAGKIRALGFEVA
jgi:phage gpG-like protein